MAKMTMHGVTYEGTPEELREIIATFEAGSEPEVTIAHDGKHLRKVARKSKTGDYVRFRGLTSVYTKNEVLYEVVDGNQYYPRTAGMSYAVYGWGGCKEPEIFEVIAQSKPKSAESLTHNGADYSLVQRKAQPGDVVYVTKDAEGTAAIPNDAKYLVDVDGKIDGFEVYPKYYKRTVANVLVYEKVAEDKPREFKEGDIVRLNQGTGADIKGTIVEISTDGARSYRRLDRDLGRFGSYPNWFELIAPVESCVDVK